MPAVSLLAVVVLYLRRLEESESFVSLEAITGEVPGVAEQLHLLIFDNSPESHPLPQTSIATTYCHDAANGGLAPAYNLALALARDLGTEWILLLDQDTLLNADYLKAVLAFIAGEGRTDTTIGAAIPRLIEGEIIHSPRLRPKLKHGHLPENAHGIATQSITAYNSGAVVRVAAMRQIGGFPGSYPLDFLDHAVFHRLQSHGSRIWLLQSTLKHKLSTLSLAGTHSLQRYAKMLESERRFHLENERTIDLLWYRLRMLRRICANAVHTRNSRVTLLEIRSLLGLKT